MAEMEKARMTGLSRQAFGGMGHGADFARGVRRTVGATILVAVTVAAASLASLLSLAAYA